MMAHGRARFWGGASVDKQKQKKPTGAVRIPHNDEVLAEIQRKFYDNQE